MYHLDPRLTYQLALSRRGDLLPARANARAQAPAVAAYIRDAMPLPRRNRLPALRAQTPEGYSGMPKETVKSGLQGAAG